MRGRTVVIVIFTRMSFLFYCTCTFVLCCGMTSTFLPALFLPLGLPTLDAFLAALPVESTAGGGGYGASFGLVVGVALGGSVAVVAVCVIAFALSTTCQRRAARAHHKERQYFQRNVLAEQLSTDVEAGVESSRGEPAEAAVHQHFSATTLSAATDFFSPEHVLAKLPPWQPNGATCDTAGGGECYAGFLLRHSSSRCARGRNILVWRFSRAPGNGSQVSALLCAAYASYAGLTLSGFSACSSDVLRAFPFHTRPSHRRQWMETPLMSHDWRQLQCDWQP